MEIRNGLSLLDNLLPLNGRANGEQAIPPQNTVPIKPPKKPTALDPQDTLSLSKRPPPSEDQANNDGQRRPQTNGLLNERTEEIENGFRRLREFQNSDGRNFTRIEEVVSNEDQSRRTVVQQSASGSTTLLENIIDRQDDGSFRVTQRFVDETGESKTNIKYNQTPDDADFILGRTSQPRTNEDNPFKALRGTQLNVEV